MAAKEKGNRSRGAGENEGAGKIHHEDTKEDEKMMRRKGGAKNKAGLLLPFARVFARNLPFLVPWCLGGETFFSPAPRLL